MAKYVKVLFSRNFTSSIALRESLAEPLRESQVNPPNHNHSSALWKKLFFFACVPALILASINVYLADELERPEFKKYAHLRIRNKPFPWGDGNHSLFHHPYYNALPDGYEVDTKH